VQQAVDLIEARSDLRAALGRTAIAGVRRLVGGPHKLLQFPAFGLQQFLEHPGLSDLGGLRRIQYRCGEQRSVTARCRGRWATGISGQWR
jgi:hypothetical protein